MFRRTITIAATMALAASSLLADFSYREKTTITGGAMASMMKMAAVFSKQAREPIETSVSIKGDRMTHRSATHMSIIDLNAETITSVDLQKKTYTVMTFEQMKQMMQQMQQRMNNQKKSDDPNAPDVSFKVTVNATGASKQVAGMEAKESIIKMEMQGTDQKSGQSGSMIVTVDQWTAAEIPGYREVRDFNKRMATKIAWTSGENMFASRPDIAKGMAEAQKQAASLEGIPVLSLTKMSGASAQPDGTTPAAQSQQQQQPPPQQVERPSLGGLIGGGFGIKRSKKDSSAPAKSDASGSGSGDPNSLIEMTTERSGFSSTSVDDAEFAVPAGFKKVEVRER